MQRRVARIAVVVGLLLALTATSTAGAPAAQADPTMAITPSRGLVDGQTVTVSVTGLQPLSIAGIAQCVEGRDVDGCEMDGRTFVSTDAQGSFTTTITLHAMLSTPSGAVDCRTSAEACVVGSNTGIDSVGAVWTITEFDPVAPLASGPSLIAQPSTALVDGQTVTVTGSGYPVNTGYAVLQCAHGTDETDCATSMFPTIAFTGASGNFTQQLAVQSGLVTRGGDFVDCRAAVGACEIRVGTVPVTNRTGIAPLSFDPDGPLRPRPSIAVEPAADLVDRQAVRVTVVGFGAQASVQVQQCATDGGYCQPVGFGLADDDGVVTLDVRVDALLWFGDAASTVDCRVARCWLQATGYPSPDIAVTDLAFAPDAPLAPPPVLEGEPATGLVDGQVIALQGRGFSVGYGFIGTVVGSVEASLAALRAPTDVVVQAASMPAVQCRAGGSNFEHCDYGTVQTVGVADDGSLAGPFQVEAVLQTNNGPVDCRTAAATCEIRTGLIGHPLKQAVLALEFDADAPLAPDPTFRVDPATDLVEGQVVQATGDGLPVHREVWVLQCQAGADLLDGCFSPLTSATVDGDGHLRVDVAVQRMLQRPFDQFDCATAPRACELVVVDTNYRMVGHVPLEFRQTDPPTTQPPTTQPPDTEPPTSGPPTSTTADVEVLATVQTRPQYAG